MDKKYVPNDVFKFNVRLGYIFSNTDIVIYTKPFPDLPPGECKNYEDIQKFYDSQEDLVRKKYFTQEKIDELKQIFIKRIQESKCPFDIYCVDRDGGFNVTEDQLFDLECSEEEKEKKN